MSDPGPAHTDNERDDLLKHRPILAQAVADHLNALRAEGLEAFDALELTKEYQAFLLDPERSEGEGVG